MTASEQNVRAVVVDALVGMVSGVTGMIPPTDTPLPDFIQGPVDRAVSKIEVARAADKARIAAQQWLLEMCQQSLLEHGESYVELDAYLRDDIDHSEVMAIKAEHEAALAQQGKEGVAFTAPGAGITNQTEVSNDDQNQ